MSWTSLRLRLVLAGGAAVLASLTIAAISERALDRIVRRDVGAVF